MKKVLMALLVALAALGVSSEARAFCGFYVSGADGRLFNNATMVVLMRDGQRTVLSMQNNYKGPTKDFALVIPVPVVLEKENVKTLPEAIFDRVDQLAAPRLVEYWEQDPCGVEYKYERSRAPRPAPARKAKAGGRGGADLGVTIEAQFKVGEYEIVILSAKDSTGLDTWLKREKYKIPEGAEPVLRPYVAQGMKFFVAKVDTEKVRFEDGQAVLSPLRFHYDTKEFSLPVRLGLLNSGGDQDLIVHILAKGKRYEVANYENVTIPTNLDVTDETRHQFGEFYTALFAKTLAKTRRSVVTEYSWDASSCDPCPTPALRPNELATLGADVISSDSEDSAGAPFGKPTLGPPGMRPPPRRRRGRSGRRFWRGGFVLTRLHARYNKNALGDDLVFKEAPPIAGGRERRAANGELEQGGVPSRINNFQARYAIRHPWTGPINCDNPRRGRWGGPPDGVKGSTKPEAAANLGFKRRKAVQLTSFLKQDLGELGVKAATKQPVAAPTATDNLARTGKPSGDAKSSSSCGACWVRPESSGRSTAALLALLGLAAIGVCRRRRR